MNRYALMWSGGKDSALALWCGQNGEYHSFAFAGPFFARPVAWRAGERRDDGRFAQLDLYTEVLVSM